MSTTTDSGNYKLTPEEHQALCEAAKIEHERAEREKARADYAEQENKELWKLVQFSYKLVASARGNINKVFEQTQLFFSARSEEKVQNK